LAAALGALPDLYSVCNATARSIDLLVDFRSS